MCALLVLVLCPVCGLNRRHDTQPFHLESTRLLHPSWQHFLCLQAAYLGPVIVSIDCELTEAKSTPLGAAIPPLNFSVRQSVPVRSTGYSLGAGLA